VHLVRNGSARCTDNLRTNGDSLLCLEIVLPIVTVFISSSYLVYLVLNLFEERVSICEISYIPAGKYENHLRFILYRKCSSNVLRRKVLNNMYYNIESGAFETGSVESETKKEAVITVSW